MFIQLKPVIFALILFGGPFVGLAEGQEKKKNGYTREQLRLFLQANEVELFSLHPANYPPVDPFGADAVKDSVVTDFGFYHQNPVLGKTTLSTQDDLKSVHAAIAAIHHEALRWNGAVAMCFWPRHCLRLKDGKRNYDLLICYECCRAQIFDQESLVGFIEFNSGDPMSSANSTILNHLLRTRGVTPPPPPNP